MFYVSAVRTSLIAISNYQIDTTVTSQNLNLSNNVEFIEK